MSSNEEGLVLVKLNFASIDFETACSDRSSVCAVGVVTVYEGVVTDRWSTLVQPPTGLDSFHPRNIAIHGITTADVADAPTWDEVYPQLMALIGDADLVAHNAPFDRSVMQGACSAVNLDWPTNAWHDSLAMARRTLTLGSYSLPFVSAALGLPSFDHHAAAADAEQAALITIELARRVGAEYLNEMSARLNADHFVPAERLATGDFSMLGIERPLDGMFVAFTGKLTTNTRDEAIMIVNHLGGVGQSSVTSKTTMLVTGDLDPRTFRPGVAMSSKLQKAMSMAEAGRPIEIVTEVDFLNRIALSRETLERATRVQRTVSRGVWLPGYVIEQAKTLDPTMEYNVWLRGALRHPDGRASGGDPCIRCGSPMIEGLSWWFAERHVCGGDCAESLKRTAKREWDKIGIRRPAPPTYDDLCAWKSSAS